MIGIVDYGLGNVQAISNLYHRLGIPSSRATTPRQLKAATRILLPGVGSFDWAMSRLEASGMRESLDEMVLDKKVPVLGICVGMQMLAKSSEEGSLPGLGWIDADNLRFRPADGGAPLYLPHMGWNDVVPARLDGLFKGFAPSEQFYFLHSYFVSPKKADNVLASTDYGGRFASAIRSSNIQGVQFHPEKSHGAGMRLLKNFAEGA